MVAGQVERRPQRRLGGGEIAGGHRPGTGLAQHREGPYRVPGLGQQRRRRQVAGQTRWAGLQQRGAGRRGQLDPLAAGRLRGDHRPGQRVPEPDHARFGDQQPLGKGRLQRAVAVAAHRVAYEVGVDLLTEQRRRPDGAQVPGCKSVGPGPHLVGEAARQVRGVSGRLRLRRRSGSRRTFGREEVLDHQRQALRCLRDALMATRFVTGTGGDHLVDVG